MPKTTTTTTTAPQDVPAKGKRSVKKALPAVPVEVPTTPVAPVPAAAPAEVPETPIKGKRTRKAAASTEAPVAVPAEVPVAVSVETTSVPANDTPNLEVSAESNTLIMSVCGISHADIQTIMTGLSDLEKQIVSSRVALRSVLRGFDRLSKEFSKVSTRLTNVTTERNELKTKLSELQASKKIEKKPRKPSTTPSGFSRQSELSPALCEFMGIPAESTRSRNQVMDSIRAYINEHDLKSKVEKRGFEFLPDAKLTALLGPAQFPLKNSKRESDRILDLGYSHFNIQSYLSPHILKTVPLVPESPTA